MDLRADTGGHGIVFGLTGWTEGATYFRATAGHIAPVGLASLTWPGAPVPIVLHPAAPSADGTTIPMVVLRPPHASGRIPTVLAGYGAYGDGSTMPFYSPITATWLAHGRKQSFFEKGTKKLSSPACVTTSFHKAASLSTQAREESFLLLFFKKEGSA